MLHVGGQASAHFKWPSPEIAEPSLIERPLRFLCEYSSSPPSWQPVVWDEPRRSFAFHRRQALGPDMTEWFYTRLQAVAPWKELKNKAGTRVARHTAWHTGNRDCRCEYTYGMDTRVPGAMDAGSTNAELEFQRVMDDLVAAVFGGSFPQLPREAWPDCANLNFYADGTQGVGWHADDELLFQGASRDCPIVSLSLGGAREFWVSLKSVSAPDVRQGVAEVDLCDGDLLTMEGLMQKHCTHFVPMSCHVDPQRQSPRINVTFRWIRVHKLQCPLAQQARETSTASERPLDLLGKYKLIADSRLNDGPLLSDGDIGRLAPGMTVDVVEIKLLELEKRVRARITNPAGWFSLLNLETGKRWASLEEPMKQAPESRASGTDAKALPGTCNVEASLEAVSQDADARVASITCTAESAARGVSRFFKIVDPETGLPVEKPERLAEDRSQFLAEAQREGAIVLSPLPRAAWSLFGDDPHARDGLPPRPGGLSSAYVQRWPTDAETDVAQAPTARWQACDNCGHECYGGGRACREGLGAWSGQWFCRCCWESWAYSGAQQYGGHVAYSTMSQWPA